MLKKISSFRSVLLNGLILTLSIAVLAAVTFAWFTDSAKSNGSTQLTIGTLDVSTTELEYLNTSAIVEPGGTYKLGDVTITNEGDVNLNYNAAIEGLDQLASLGLTYSITGDLTGTLAPKATAVIGVTVVCPTTLADNPTDKTYMGKSLPSLKMNVTATQAEGDADSSSQTGSTNYDAVLN